MRILDRYLATATLNGTLLTFAALLPLLGFFLFADELDGLGGAGQGPVGAFGFMLLGLPNYAYQIFPLATLIGALIGLGSLASRSELVAMRAAGVSIAGLARAAMLGGLLLAALAFALGEYLVPAAERHGLELRRQALSGELGQYTPDGFWAIEGGTYVNIREIRAATWLRDLHIYEPDLERGTLVATQAEEARYRDGRWVLAGIVRSRAGPDGVAVERIAAADWDSLLDPGLLAMVAADPWALPIRDLHRYIGFMRINGQDAGTYEVAFWGKVLHPFLTLSMILVAIPILLGTSRTGGLGVRLFAAILVGILYYLLSRTLAFLSLTVGLSPLAAALAPLLLFVAVALLLLRRAG